MKLSLCNEVVRDMPFARQCEFVAALGYEGLEVAPFTVFDDPTEISAGQRQQLRRDAEAAGIAVSGLHYLMLSPEGLSITTDDEAVRTKSIDLMRHLIGVCGDVGGDVLVHGSPAQRRLPDNPAAAGDAYKRGVESFAAIAEAAEAAGVIYCIEPLAAPQANFVNTLEEAVAIVKEIDSPNVRTMIDCSAAGVMEAEPVADVIDHWLPSGFVAHVQVNDTNRRGPGQGDNRFGPILAALKRQDYEGWIAAEPFVYEPDGPATASFCAGYMKGLLEGLH